MYILCFVKVAACASVVVQRERGYTMWLYNILIKQFNRRIKIFRITFATTIYLLRVKTVTWHILLDIKKELQVTIENGTK